jgi:hypothetical protein
MWRIWLTILFLLVMPMAELAHAFVEQTTRQTVTGVTYGTVASIPSSEFVADGVYIIRITALIDSSTTNFRMETKFIHGSTDFSGVEYAKKTLTAGSGAPYTYIGHQVWTAVSGEAINLQIRGLDAAQVVGADTIAMVVARLDADLVENTDYWQAERNVDDALDTTGVNGANISLTPPAGTDLLVLTCSRIDVDSVTSSFGSRIISTGTFNESSPSGVREGEISAEFLITSHARVFTGLAASAQTFTEQSFSEQSSGGIRTNSKLFAIRLDVFKNHVSAWTVAAEVLGTTDWADPFQVGISLTPDVAGDVWIIANAVFDAGNALREVAYRLQVDNVDQPTGWEAGDLIESTADATDEMPFGTQTVENLTAAAHTFDFEGDASGGTTGAPEVEDRMLCAFTFELAAGAAQPLIVKPTLQAVKVAAEW